MAGGAGGDADEAITGINVTPLVDITLVLLIIFMVTAKIIVSQSVPLDLPKAATGLDVQTVFSIVMAANGSAQVDSRAVPNDDAILVIAHDAALEERGAARGHQGRLGRAPRARHSRARPSEAGGRLEDRVRGHPRRADDRPDGAASPVRGPATVSAR